VSTAARRSTWPSTPRSGAAASTPASFRSRQRWACCYPLW
jgi:hypothetical protein